MQMNFPTVVALNGPPGIGKSWLAARIAGIIEGNRKIIGLKDLIWQEFNMHEQWAGSYAAYKSHVFHDGTTGRERIINYAEGKRRVDLHYWDRQYTSSALYMNTEIVINDSLRKLEEQNWLFTHAKELITIVMCPTRYSIGCMYEGDSGVCLPPRGGFRTTDSDKALVMFKAFWAARQSVSNDIDSSNGINEGNAEEQVRRPALVGGPLVESRD